MGMPEGRSRGSSSSRRGDALWTHVVVLEGAHVGMLEGPREALEGAHVGMLGA